MGERGLLVLVVVAGILALSGLGYIYSFSGVFGNGIYLSPGDASGGVQFSPSRQCQEICEDGVFMGCQGSFEDLQCGLSCRGIVDVGTEIGRMPKIGSTLCKFVDCVCG
jgi:hypothetical protein